jgi:hypothetical protein
MKKEGKKPLKLSDQPHKSKRNKYKCHYSCKSLTINYYYSSIYDGIHSEN